MAELRIDLPAYAAELFRPHRYKVLWGGRGAARSWSVARALLIEAARRPLRVLCTRELQTSIRDSVHRLLRDQADLLGLRFRATDREITHANGSLFIFEGLRYNVTKIKSLEGIDRCWVEEAERVSAGSWEVLIPTVRKPASEIWVTFNPDRDEDATYQRFVVAPPPDAWVKRVSADDNPWLPPELLAERAYLYRVDPDAAAHVWGGETRGASDAQVLKGKWAVEEFTPAAAWDGPYQGMDFGFANDPTTLVRCWVAERRLYVEYELYRVGLELDATAPAALQAVPEAAAYVVRADSARPESISYLRRHGLPRIVGVEKWKGSVEDGIAHLRQYEQIVIHPRCKHVADEARLYSYRVDERSGDVMPDVLDANNHTIDALRYALAPLIRRKASLSVYVPGVDILTPEQRARREAEAARRAAAEAEHPMAPQGRTIV